MGCPSMCQLGDNLVFSICTHDADTGVLTVAEAAPTYRIYEDETATAILTGTLTALDDAVNTTGFYTELIEVTTANGFEVGKNYTVYIEATVDGDTGGIAYTFKVEGIADAVWDELVNRVDEGEIASLEDYEAMVRDGVGMAAADLDTQLDAILAAAGSGGGEIIERIAAIAIGNVSGARTGTEVFAYGSVSATVTCDSDGNRSIVFS